MPKVSVIIPAYNAEKYIGETLESLGTQTLGDIEVIVVDDGSSDTTPKIAEGYAAKDKRFSLIRQQNQFAGVARNNGMSKATGEFLYFLDADDYCDPTCLEQLVGAAEEHNADVVCTRAFYHDDQNGNEGTLDYTLTGLPFGVALGQDELAANLFQAVKGWPWDKLFRAEPVRKAGLEFQASRTSNDALFVFMAMAQASCTVCLETPLVYHRISNKSSLENTRNRSWGCAIEAAHAIKAALEAAGLYAKFEQSYQNWIADFFCWNLSTLDSENATAFLAEAKDLLDALPREAAYYANPKDAFFVKTLDADRAELIGQANTFWQSDQQAQATVQDLARQLDELYLEYNERMRQIALLRDENTALAKEIRDVRQSASYKVGNVLIQPASKLKWKLKR